MERKQKFNDGWMFLPREINQSVEAVGRTKSGSCGGASNATNEEGRFYPLPQNYWAVLGGSGEEAGNICLNLSKKLEDNWEPAELPHDWKIRQGVYKSPEDGRGLHGLGGDCLPVGKGYYRKAFDLRKKVKGKGFICSLRE